MTFRGGAVARFAMRQSLRWSYLAPIAIVFGLVVSTAQAGALLPWVPLFALVYAFPYAATQFVQADRDGRLNHLRVTGQASPALLASLALGWAGPLIAVGILSLAALWMAGRTATAESVLLTAAIIGGSMTLSLLALVLPRGERAADSRLVAIGLGFFALVASFIQLAFSQTSDVRPRGFVLATVAALAAEVVVSAACIPFVLRTVRRPSEGGGRRGAAFRVRGLAFAPIAAHAFSLCVPAAMFVTALATVVLPLLLWRLSGLSPDLVWGYIVFLAYMPLLVGAFVISTGARADRDAGRLELLRVSPRSPSRVLVELALGAGLPFIIATIAIHLVALVVWGDFVGGLAAAALATFVLAPVAGLEGWRGAWPLTYVLPMTVLMLRLSEGPAAGTLFGAATPYVRIALVAWIPWAAALRTLRQPNAIPLPGATAVAAAVALVIAMLIKRQSAIGVVADASAVLLIVAGVTVGPRRSRARDLAIPAVAVAVTTAAMLAGDVLGYVNALALAPAPALAWWIGCRVHMSLGTAPLFSIAVRVALAAALTMFWPFVYSIGERVSPGADRAAFVASQIRTSVALTALLLAAAIVVESSYRLWRRRG